MKPSKLQLQDLPWESFVLTAVDPALQGVYMWGFPDDVLHRVQRLLMRWSARPGPVVRISVTTTPRELHDMFDTEQTFVRGSPYYRPGLVARAESGIILISSTDLVRADTAAALNAALSSRPLETRPLVLASSGSPPAPDCPIASACALWLDGSSQLYDHSAIPWDRGQVCGGSDGQSILNKGPDADLDQVPTWDGHVVSAARSRLYSIPLRTEIIEEIARRTATAGCAAPTVDFYVARAARARAAVYGRDHVTGEDLDAAVHLVAAPRATVRRRHRDASHHHHQDVVQRDVSPWGSGASAMGESGSTTDVATAGRAQIDGSATGGEVTGTSETTATGASSARQGNGDGGNTDDLSRRSKISPANRDSPRPNSRNRTDPDGDDDNSPVANPAVIVVPPEDLFQILTLPEKNLSASVNVRSGTRRNGSRPTGPIQGVTAHKNGISVAVAPTIAAAIPWQRIRPPRPSSAVRIMPEDLRRYRRQARPAVLYVLVVDGSGSMAQSRMQLAKGAALAVLQGAYKQRRYVSLVEFRGRHAAVLCPPGRSASSVRRLVTELGSGGGTPLPSALDVTRRLAAKWRTRHADGHVRVIIFTDGKANVPLNSHLPATALRNREDKTVTAPEQAAVLRTDGRAADTASPSPRTAPHVGSESVNDDSLTAIRERRRRVWLDLERTAAALLADGVDCHIVDAGAVRAGAELARLASLLQAPILKVVSHPRVRRRHG